MAFDGGVEPHLHGEGEDDGAAAETGSTLATGLSTLGGRAGRHGVLAADTVAENELGDDCKQDRDVARTDH